MISHHFVFLFVYLAVCLSDLSLLATPVGWWSGVVVSTLASINEVNLRRARLVLRI